MSTNFTSSLIPNQNSKIFSTAVLVAALGYFVDIYDLVLFSVVRVASLKSIGIADGDLLSVGGSLISWQMMGMLIGGIFWGILGDKKGRLSVLFGSILLYSIANIANGTVESVSAYKVWRFIAGVGLAGELGAGITLVSEVMSKESRGLGTMVVATVGVSGALLAGMVAKFFDWRTTYYIGGGLGLALLLLRVGVYESGMFSQVKSSKIVRGDFLSLFKGQVRFFKYLRCILIGVPIWYVVGILVTFSPEFAVLLGVVGSVEAGTAIMSCYFGLTFGDFLSGYLSHILASRKKVILGFMAAMAIFVASYFLLTGISAFVFYLICFAMGVASGYWAVFVTIAAEQFGTNLRATVTTTVPNFVRGSVPLLLWMFETIKAGHGILIGGAVVGVLCLIVAFVSLMGLEETFGRDLDFVEVD